MLVVKFKEQFHKVFDDDFNIKPCGRAEVIKLILSARDLTGTSNAFGNSVTGFMDKDALVNLYKSLDSEI